MTQGRREPWTRWTAAADERLVLAAINRSSGAWLTAEAIAAATQLPLDRIHGVLDTSRAGVIEAAPGVRGEPVRYSTLEHYRRTTGWLRRYLDAVVSS